MKKTTVICVLKTGGDFDSTYVRKLQNAVKRHLNLLYEFICLTDDPTIDFCKTIPLKHNWKSWWSKIELFRPDLDLGMCLYFDLDVVMLKNIDILFAQKQSFIGLQPFNPLKRDNPYLINSSIMKWQSAGEFNYIYEQFQMKEVGEKFRGDQDYIGNQLVKKNKEITHWQSLVDGIYSYKRHCLGGLPKDARIVCFHGRPRPCNIVEKWVEENWI